MAEETITKAKHAFKIFTEKLNEANLALDLQDRVSIERLTTTEGPPPRHQRGIIGLIYSGDNFEKDPNTKGPSLIMKRDILIGVVPWIRYIDNPLLPIDETRKLPMDYVELAIDALSGIEVFNHRPQFENKVFPLRAELNDEKDGWWRYLITFSVPCDFVETSIRT